MFLVFEEKHPKKLSSCFGSDSALKTINTQMLFCSVFLKTHKKSYLPQKTPFWSFLKINNFFSCNLKNTDLNNICASIVFKVITNKKYEENFFLSFLFQKSKMRFFGGHQIFLKFFF